MEFKIKLAKKTKVEAIDDAEGTPGASRQFTRFNHECKSKIEEMIDAGADVIMLPFFQNAQQVQRFINAVDGRVKTNLLVETPEAAENIDKILEIDGIDEIHIGLNDLHLGYGMTFMFELVADGTVQKLCEKIKKKNIRKRYYSSSLSYYINRTIMF